jgi:hypothetical protein
MSLVYHIFANSSYRSHFTPTLRQSVTENPKNKNQKSRTQPPFNKKPTANRATYKGSIPSASSSPTQRTNRRPSRSNFHHSHASKHQHARSQQARQTSLLDPPLSSTHHTPKNVHMATHAHNRILCARRPHPYHNGVGQDQRLRKVEL